MASTQALFFRSTPCELIDRGYSKCLLFSICLAVLVTSGCTDRYARVAGPRRAAQLALADASIPAKIPAPQMRWVRVARGVPGFGGFWYDSTGNYHIYLLNREDSLRAKDALVRVLGVNRTHLTDLQTHRMIVEQGKYDFRELYVWMRTLSRLVHRVEGFQSLSVRHNINAVRIGVVSPEAQEGFRDLIDELDIPDDAVVVELEERMRSSATLSDSAHVRIGGLKMQSQFFKNCTLGINVNGGFAFLTASHCTYRRGADGFQNLTYWYQPTLTSGNEIGYEVSDPEWMGQEDIDCCDFHQPKCRYSDAALMTYNDEFEPGTAGQGLIAKTTFEMSGNFQPGSDTISGNLIIQQQYFYAAGGSVVAKIGFATGWTYGTVYDDCSIVEIDGYQVVCSVLVNGAYSLPGDSGAPTFKRVAGTDSVLWAGLLFASAGNSFRYSHAELIIQELGNNTYAR